MNDIDPFELNRAAYDVIAPTFAEVNTTMPDAMQAAAERLILSFEDRSIRILDIGCGTGRDLAWFASRGVRGIGVDLSFGMLRQAQSICPAPLAQLDMRHLSFPDRSFTAIWCAAALLHIPKKLVPSVLNEMSRVLVPGGSMYLSVQKGVGEVIERDQYTGKTNRFFDLFEPDELHLLLKRTGFSILDSGEREGRRPWLWFIVRKPD